LSNKKRAHFVGVPSGWSGQILVLRSAVKRNEIILTRPIWTWRSIKIIRKLGKNEML